MRPYKPTTPAPRDAALAAWIAAETARASAIVRGADTFAAVAHDRATDHAFAALRLETIATDAETDDRAAPRAS